ncbi:hypothetical protein RB623_26625 [Mesorhizobium sp. LHD-90]|uniref:COG3904 family protein n=1 Tax=Mesorhizobium sp. LHD-90 TaxID=3071414 RepID=UPI0027E0EBC3|nr:hypothetical protein [Mesorhizobium sp. LHD-90]MDQ6437642.1 hypothetical protein [Mesorhizobium sp. LHD-90]
MQFAVVRSNAAGCEPTCPEWISAEGAIVAATPGQFKKLLKQLAGRRLPVVVSSPGGDVDAALTLGRLIRQNRLDVAVGLTRFDGCHPAAKNCKPNEGKAAAYYGNAFAGGAYCASACPLVLAGGVRRVVGQWAYLGVHQVTTTYFRTKVLYRTKYKVVKGKKRVIEKKVVSRKNAGSYKTYEMNKSLEKKLAAYLEEMGIGDNLLAAIKSTPATTLHQIVPYTMLQMKLITSLDDAELLTAANVCKAVPAAGNCRVVTESDIEG